jgi:hypothetical protein
MKLWKLLITALTVGALVGAFGPAQAQTRDIIEEFCETVTDDAGETLGRLADATESLARCVDDFGDCRHGGLFGNDPLIECLADGIECTARAAGEKAEACGEFKEDFADAYERALRQSRREDVEDDVQEFFNNQGPGRRRCLRPAIQVGRVCSEIEQ